MLDHRLGEVRNNRAHWPGSCRRSADHCGVVNLDVGIGPWCVIPSATLYKDMFHKLLDRNKIRFGFHWIIEDKRPLCCAGTTVPLPKENQISQPGNDLHPVPCLVGPFLKQWILRKLICDEEIKDLYMRF